MKDICHDFSRESTAFELKLIFLLNPIFDDPLFIALSCRV